MALVFAITLLVLLLCLFLCVIGGGSNVHRSNPSHDMSSKQLRNQEAPEGSNAPQRNIKKTANKFKEPNVGMDEMPQAEFITQRRINPYVNPCENVRGDSCSRPSNRISSTSM